MARVLSCGFELGRLPARPLEQGDGAARLHDSGCNKDYKLTKGRYLDAFICGCYELVEDYEQDSTRVIKKHNNAP